MANNLVSLRWSLLRPGSNDKLWTFLTFGGHMRWKPLTKKLPAAVIRVGHGFWVYGIQGLFKSSVRYIAA